MTMPHTKRPRRARVNKLRAWKGLPPLGELPDIIEPRPPISGTTTIMVPLPTETRTLLSKIRLETQRRDPRVVSNDQLFAGALLTAIVAQLDQSMFPAETPLVKLA